MFSKLWLSIRENEIAMSIILASAYFVAGKLGLSLAFVHVSATAIWPPTGIAIASFLLLGYRVWPGIFLGAFLVNITTEGSILTTLGIASGNTLEGLIGAYLINKFAQGRDVFDEPRNIFKFAALAAVVSTMISATFGVTSLSLGGYAEWANYWKIWPTWWLGDLAGALIVTPAVVLLSRRSYVSWNLYRLLEIVAVFLLLLIVSQLIFLGKLFFTSLGNYPIEYFVIPILIWLAFRFSQQEVMVAIIFLSVIAIWGTLNGFGPFAGVKQNESLLLLQSFISVITLTALVLAAAVREETRLSLAILESEEKYRKLIETSPDAIIVADLGGTIQVVNKRALRMYGYSSEEEVLGKSTFEFVASEDQKKIRIALAELIGKGKVSNIKYASMKKNREKMQVETNASLLLDTKGRPQSFIAVIRDVTERANLEANLRYERNQIKTIITALNEGVIVTNTENTILIFNKMAEVLTGFNDREAIGSDIRKVLSIYKGNKKIPDKDLPTLKTLTTKRPITTTVQDDYFYKSRDGKLVPVVFSTTSLFQYNFNVVILIFRDVSREKEIDRMKTEFLSLAAHQLRGPLGLMRWNMEMLLRPTKVQLPDELKDKIQKIYADNQRMIALVNDLLNVSRIDQGRIQEEMEKINLLEEIKNVVEELRNLTESKSIKIGIVEESEGLQILADSKHFHEVIANLISNSIKYNRPEGKIEIKIGRQNNFAQISIKDSGIGIPKESQKKIFTRFFRAPNATSIDSGGTGLGLFMVKFYTEKWGGKTWFESEEGKGSTFFVQVPIYK